MTEPLRGAVDAPPYLTDPEPDLGVDVDAVAQIAESEAAIPTCRGCSRPALVDGYCRSQACADARARARARRVPGSPQPTNGLVDPATWK